MGTIELAGALADPEEVGRAVVVETRGGVLAGESLFIGEEEALVRGPELGCGHDRMVHREPSSSHEPQGLINTVCQLLIPIRHYNKQYLGISMPFPLKLQSYFLPKLALSKPNTDRIHMISVQKNLSNN